MDLLSCFSCFEIVAPSSLSQSSISGQPVSKIFRASSLSTTKDLEVLTCPGGNIWKSFHWEVVRLLRDRQHRIVMPRNGPLSRGELGPSQSRGASGTVYRTAHAGKIAITLSKIRNPNSIELYPEPRQLHSSSGQWVLVGCKTPRLRANLGHSSHIHELIYLLRFHISLPSVLRMA